MCGCYVTFFRQSVGLREANIDTFCASASVVRAKKCEHSRGNRPGGREKEQRMEKKEQKRHRLRKNKVSLMFYGDGYDAVAC